MIQRPAKYAACCGCDALKMCAPVTIVKSKWFWFCADCARAIGCAWAACCRQDGALQTQTLGGANDALAATGGV